jgi:hypothetical protein
MAVLDAEIARGIRARDARRQHAAREILRRTALGRKKKLTTEEQNLAADVLSMLTSFETDDALAKAGHNPRQIIAAVTRLARLALS